jgi:hypothetical protein
MKSKLISLSVTKKRHRELIIKEEFEYRKKLFVAIQLNKRQGDLKKIAKRLGINSVMVTRIIQSGTIERLEQVVKELNSIRENEKTL